MIPYDDLVAALQQWRARQGLPVSTLGGGGSSAAPQPGSGPYAQPGSGPYGQPGSGPYGQPGSGPYGQPGSEPYGEVDLYGQPGSGPARSAPPAPPRGKPSSIPPPLAAADETMHEVGDAEMLEEHYDSEGADYAMSYGGQQQGDDQTSLGEEPDGANDGGHGNGRGGRDDW
jgi:hypothetical protein